MDDGGLVSQMYLYLKIKVFTKSSTVVREEAKLLQEKIKIDPFKDKGQNMSKFSWCWESSIGVSQENVLENCPVIHKEEKKWQNKDMKKFFDNQKSFRMARTRASCQRTL